MEPPPGLGLGVCVGGERGFSHAFRERMVALSGGRVGGDHEVELGIGGRSRVRSPASVSRASSQRWPLLAAFCTGLHLNSVNFFFEASFMPLYRPVVPEGASGWKKPQTPCVAKKLQSVAEA